MKKYIKSKGGKIYESKDLKIDELTGQLAKDNGKELEVIVADKETDNIMELFDAIFEFFPDDNRPYCQLYYRDVDGKLYRYWNPRSCAEPLKDNVIRGVIYTDKAIIYVAERKSEEGEWKLL